MSVSETNTVTLCPDGHRCENGAICLEKENDENSFICDCEEAGPDSAFAGLYCEHKATTYCMDDLGLQVPSKVAFCTNAGKCKERLSNDASIHYGCECGANYEGSHCQFVKGSMPADYQQSMGQVPQPSSSGANKAGLGPFAIALIVIAAAIVLMGVVFFVVRSSRKSTRTPSTEQIESATADLQFDENSSPLPSPTAGSSLPNAEEVKAQHIPSSPAHVITDEEDGMDGEII